MSGVYRSSGCAKRAAPTANAALTGLSRTGVFDICKRYAQSGSSALHDAVGGRKPGEQRLLSLEQEILVQKLIAEKTPDQLQMPYALWSRAAVAEFIEQRFALTLKVRTMGMYLKRWGLTPQKPMPKTHEPLPAAVKRWLEEESPAIAQRAKAQGAQIHWADESVLRSDDVRGRSYAPKGQTPVMRVPNKRHGPSIISTVTNKRQMRWRIFDAALNSTILIDFFKRLIKGQKKKVLLILDNLRGHHSKPVKQWLAEHAQHIEVLYLPATAPNSTPARWPMPT